MKSYFLFNTREGHYLVESKHVETVPKPRELIRRAATVDVLREYIEKQGIELAKDKARKKSKHTQETKDKISASLKANHPHKNGLSEKHINSIKKYAKNRYNGENNNMYGRKQKLSTRLKISEKRRSRGKYKYICNPHGYTAIPVDQPIPEGWQRGTIYDPYRPEDL